MNGNLHEGHREKMKERFTLTDGFDFQDHELLELLLFFSKPRVNTNETAHLLLEKFGSIRNILDASHDALTTIEGVGPASAQLIRLVNVLMRRYVRDEDTKKKPCIRKPADIVPYLQRLFFGIGNERVYLLLFSNTGTLMREIMINEGNSAHVLFDVSKCTHNASLFNPAMVILAHNHPHGIAAPSDEDFRTTEEMRAAFEALRIPMIEHIIIADDNYCMVMDTMEKNARKTN